MTQEQIEYDEEQYRNFDSSLESLIGKEYCYKNKSGDSITVKFSNIENGNITFRYDDKYINTEFCIVDTKYNFSYYNILDIAINELLYELISNINGTSILMGFLINYNDLEINSK
jgi:hypothetical protein